MNENENETAEVFACTLPPPERRRRRVEVLAAVRRRVKQIVETESGFVFTFEKSDGLRDELDELVRFEAACCAFIDMHLTERDATIELSMRGKPGAKPFIFAELVDVPVCCPSLEAAL